MAFFELNKPGHGKWTRILTAAGIGIIVVFGLSWILGEMEGWLGPRSQISDVTPSGQVAGETFTLEAIYTNPAGTELKGTVSYRAESTDDVKAVISALQTRAESEAAANPSSAWGLISPSSFDTEGTLRLTAKSTGVPFTVNASSTGNARLVAAVNTTARAGDATVAQGITAGVVIVLFGLFTWWLMNKESIVDFMGATETEMRKVNWPTKKEIVGSTWVVIFGTLFITLILFIVDIGFFWLFSQIGILDAGAK